MRALTALFTFLAATTVAYGASAQEVTLNGPLAANLTVLTPRQLARGPRLELTTGFGVLGRGITGTTPSFGYDSGAALTARGNVRYFFSPLADCNCAPRHGIDVGFVHAGGGSFGLLSEYAWRQYVVDAAYAFHIKLPCMSNEHREVTLTGVAGLAGQFADAGLGDVAHGEMVRLNERQQASSSYDHVSLGWRFGAAMDVRFGGFVLGVEVNLRDLYGLATSHTRTFLMEAGLRIGYQFQFSPAPRPSSYYGYSG